jgi:hypothetical protein
MSPADARTCRATGLRLIPVGGEVGYHVAKTAYSARSAATRTPDVHRDEWGRYDTLGSTYYIAETAECAYAEVLAAFKRKNGDQDVLEPIAAALGITVDELALDIEEQWAEAGFHGAGTLPPGWRNRRAIYQVVLSGGGWLVDIEHPDSIAALEAGRERFLANQGIPSLNTSVLRSENRFVTTTLAGLIRTAILEDGSAPRGIHFGSKHGGAWCRAIWDATDYLDLNGPFPIELTDPAFLAATARMRLHAF